MAGIDILIKYLILFQILSLLVGPIGSKIALARKAKSPKKVSAQNSNCDPINVPGKATDVNCYRKMGWIEEMTFKALDALDDVPLTQTWTGITPSYISEPIKLSSIDLDKVAVLEQNLSVQVDRQVTLNASERYKALGKYIVQDRFFIEYMPGPDVRIPVFQNFLQLRAAAQVTLIKEYNTIHGADTYEEAVKSGFWKRYGLPWQIGKIKDLDQAVKFPVGFGFTESSYIDGLVGTGIMASAGLPQIVGLPGALDASNNSIGIGFQTDARFFHVGTRVFFREDENTTKVFQENEIGARLQADFMFENGFIFPIRVEFLHWRHDREKLSRKAFVFDSSQSDDPVQNERFHFALGNPISTSNFESDYLVETKSLMTQTWFEFFFGIKLGPKTTRGREWIQLTSDGGKKTSVGHSYWVKEFPRKKLMAEMYTPSGAAKDLNATQAQWDQIDEGHSLFVAQIHETLMSPAVAILPHPIIDFGQDHNGKTMKSFRKKHLKEQMQKWIESLRLITNDDHLFDCNPLEDYDAKLSLKPEVEIAVTIDGMGIRKAYDSSKAEVCAVVGDIIGETLPDNCNLDRLKRIKIDPNEKDPIKAVGNFFDGIKERNILRRILKLYDDRKLSYAEWSARLVQLTSRSNYGAEYLAGLVRLAGPEHVKSRTIVKLDPKGRKKDYQCNGVSYSKGASNDDFSFGALSDLKEAANLIQYPAGEIEPHATTFGTRPSDMGDQDTNMEH